MASDMSAGVIVSPMASMSIASADCITDKVPSVVPTVVEHLMAIAAESSVHNGDNLQKALEKSANERLPCLFAPEL